MSVRFPAAGGVRQSNCQSRHAFGLDSPSFVSFQVAPPSTLSSTLVASPWPVQAEINLARAIADADVVYVLRMQRERMLPGEAYVPSLREYTLRYGVTSDRLRPGPERRQAEHRDVQVLRLPLQRQDV